MHHWRKTTAQGIAEPTGGMGALLRVGVVLGVAIWLCGCNTDSQIAGAPDAPADFRLRHPITLTEKNRTLRIFLGANRGSLTPVQRAQLLAFAQSWRSDATGGVIIDLPVGSTNTRSSAQALHEIESILAATGVPRASMGVRRYEVTAGVLAPVRVSYPRIAAEAGPCGIWPKDIGPSANRDYFENQPPWNYGCSTQHNLAVMVANPEDLVQPRAETPAYTMRRTTVMEKYRAGQTTGSTPAAGGTTAGRITDIGQ